MAMLDRYRKSGGFIQLLNLLETCGPTKQAKFLELVKAEDSRWAEGIRRRIIDINRIYSWPDQTLAEVVGTVQDLTLGVALHGTTEEIRVRIGALLGHSRKRKIDEIYDTTKPTPAEISTMNMKIIDTVRKMAADGSLRFDKFDAELVIEENIEDLLSKATAPVSASSSGTTLNFDAADRLGQPQASAEIATSIGPDRSGEILALRKKLDQVSQENSTLRHELSVVKNKLDQIRKIA